MSSVKKLRRTKFFFAVLLLNQIFSWHSFANNSKKNKVNSKLSLEEIIGKYQDKNPQIDMRDFLRRHPYHLKACASTLFLHKPGKDIFNIGDATATGHSTLYLSKVCLDKNYSYPRLILCDDIPHIKDRLPADQQGVGISSNVPFKTAHFVAIPHKMFWNGEVNDQSTFDEPELRKLIDDVTPLYDGIKFHNFLLNPLSHNKNRNSPEERKKVISFLMGSDFGQRLSRNNYCQNMPITQDMMRDLVDDLNALNDKVAFYDGKKNRHKYRWDPLRDNCAHTVHNAFSTFGAIPKRRTNANFFYNLIHPTFPANVFIEIAHLVNNTDINPVKIYLNPKSRAAFLKYNWISKQPYSFAEIIEPLDIDNKIFDIKSDIMSLPRGIFKPFTTRGVPRHGLNKFLTEEMVMKRQENLKEFKNKYLEALESTHQLLQGQGRAKYRRDLRTDEFKVFLLKFQEYLKKNLKELEVDLVKIQQIRMNWKKSTIAIKAFAKLNK